MSCVTGENAIDPGRGVDSVEGKWQRSCLLLQEIRGKVVSGVGGRGGQDGRRDEKAETVVLEGGETPTLGHLGGAHGDNDFTGGPVSMAQLLECRHRGGRQQV